MSGIVTIDIGGGIPSGIRLREVSETPQERNEKWYNAHARPTCSECKGLGMLTFYWSHDEAKNAPCTGCFPDDSWAKANAANWEKHR